MVANYNNNVVSYTYEGTKNLNGTKTFNSGNEAIDSFVTKGNLRAHAKAPGNAVTVLLDEDNEQKLVGYVTIVTHTLSREMLSSVKENVGKTPTIPIVKLNMLGVSLDYQKQGFGEALMRIALSNTKKVIGVAGCAGLYLEAAPEAISFYEKLGFVGLSPPDTKTGIQPMFLHANLIP